MFRRIKTAKSKRTSYIYYSDTGTKTIISPEDLDDENYIAILHELDDEEVDRNRREMDNHTSIYAANDNELVVEIVDKSVNVKDDVLAALDEFDIKNDKLLKAVMELNPLDQQILKLYRFEGMKQTEIAEILGLSRNAVQHRSADLIKKLRRLVIK